MSIKELTTEQKATLKQAVIQSMANPVKIDNYHELHSELCVKTGLDSDNDYSWFHPEDNRKKNYQYVCGIDEYRNMAVALGYYKVEDCY